MKKNMAKRLLLPLLLAAVLIAAGAALQSASPAKALPARKWFEVDPSFVQREEALAAEEFRHEMIDLSDDAAKNRLLEDHVIEPLEVVSGSDTAVQFYLYQSEAFPGFGVVAFDPQSRETELFPMVYSLDTTNIPPDAYAVDDLIYFVRHIWHGTGLSAADLQIFKVQETVSCFPVDYETLVDRLNRSIQVTYDQTAKTVTVSNAEGGELFRAEVTAIGLREGETFRPGSYDCGQWIKYSFDGGEITVLFDVALCDEKTGAVGWTVDGPRLRSHVELQTDENGDLSGFTVSTPTIA